MNAATLRGTTEIHITEEIGLLLAFFFCFVCFTPQHGVYKYRGSILIKKSNTVIINNHKRNRKEKPPNCDPTSTSAAGSFCMECYNLLKVLRGLPSMHVSHLHGFLPCRCPALGLDNSRLLPPQDLGLSIWGYKIRQIAHGQISLKSPISSARPIASSAPRYQCQVGSPADVQVIHILYRPLQAVLVIVNVPSLQDDKFYTV